MMRLITRSITGKLTLLIALASGAAVLLACMSFVIINVNTIRRSKVNQMSAIASMLAYNSSAGVMFMQKDSVEDLLASLEHRPSVVFAGVYDAALDPSGDSIWKSRIP